MGKKNSRLGPFMLACVMFGIQFGPSAASGTTLAGYFMKGGYLAIPLIIMFMAIECWYTYWCLETARVTGQYDLAGLMRELTYPFDKYSVPLWDILLMCLFPITASSGLSGCATVVQQLSGFSYMLSLLISSVIFVVIGIFGRELLAKCGTFLTIVILAIAALFVVCLIGPGIEAYKVVLATRHVYSSIGSATWIVLQNAMVSVSCAAVLTASAKGYLHSSKHSLATSVLACLMMGGFFVLFALVLFRGYPDIMTSNMATLDIVSQSGNTFLEVFYPIMLLAAFISTGPAYIFSVADRWCHADFWKKVNENNILRKNGTIRMTVMVMVFMCIVAAISSLGFNFIMTQIVPKQWIFYLIFLVFPLCFIAPIRVRRMRKELKKTGSVVTATDRRAAEKNDPVSENT